MGDLRLLATCAKQHPTQAVSLSCQQRRQDEDCDHEHPDEGGDGEKYRQHPRRAAAARSGFGHRIDEREQQVGQEDRQQERQNDLPGEEGDQKQQQ